jgi:hypothetical protein
MKPLGKLCICPYSLGNSELFSFIVLFNEVQLSGKYVWVEFLSLKKQTNKQTKQTQQIPSKNKGMAIGVRGL